MNARNFLLIMTDQERYAPPYESDAVAKFRKEEMPARQSLRESGLEFHRHYTGSTACLPSRVTLFTGQYPSLHGASQTDGLAKANPTRRWGGWIPTRSRHSATGSVPGATRRITGASGMCLMPTCRSLARTRDSNRPT